MSAIVSILTGKVRQLDRRAEPDEVLTAKDAADTERLARLLVRIMSDVASLRRRFVPKRIDFEDLTVDATGTAKFRLEHRFGGAVRFWVIGWDGAAAHNVRQHADTTKDVLVLTSTSAGKATVRVEEAG